MGRKVFKMILRSKAEMKFEKIDFDFEKYEALDIIAASTEEPTVPTTDPQLGTDPYEGDKW